MALVVLTAHCCCHVCRGIATAQSKSHTMTTASDADKTSVHGMLVFGTPEKDGTIFASHLPMFRSPHDYQILLELRLDPKAALLYRKSLKNFRQQTVYTIEPEPFVLPEMIAKPRPFKARLFRGHFERDGKPLGDTATVSIKRVLFFKKFDPTIQRSEAAQYLVFGHSIEHLSEHSHEYFAAHVITVKPDFDHICKLSADKKTTSVLQKRSPATPLVVVTDSKANIPLHRGGIMKVLKTSSMDDAPSSLKLGVVKELYLERDDLR